MLNRKSGLKDKVLAVLIALLGATGVAQAQEAITGPTCVVVGVQYSYTLSGPASTFTYRVNGGSVSNASYSGTSNSSSMTLLVTWGSGDPRTITLNSTIDDNTITITNAAALAPGAITSGQTQNINSGTVPAAINCAAATGGSCSPTYSYQWQSSTDNVNYSNISGATGQNLSFTSPITVTTYYRQMVNVSGGSTAYSNVATVTVYPPIIAGTISPASQSVNYGSNAATLTLSGVSGGTNSYLYQWESSPDNATWTLFSQTTTTYTPVDVTGTAYYRVLVTSNGAAAYSSSAVVNGLPELFPGSISPSNVTIVSGSSPGEITGTPASGGGCSGSYTYQWLISTDGTTYTPISGATAISYTPPALTANTWYIRQVSCSGVSVNSDVCQVLISTGTPDMNYIIARSILKPGVMDSATAAGLTSPYDVSQTTQFFDGLDRLVQTVGKQQTPLQKDMVAINAYDNYGRQPDQYLPYPATTSDGNFKATAFGDQYNFNATQYPGEQYYYSETNFEASPLNRALTTYAPGVNWLGDERGVNVQHLVNQVSDSVRIWNIAYPVGSIPTSTATYPAGTLYKTVTTDENGNQTVEYKDETGHVLLKKVQNSATPGTAHHGWLCTYYVYDEINNLRFVITPQTVTLIINTWSISAAVAYNYCYRYEYDLRSRMNIKKVPGAGETWMVFDGRDRLIMSQDSNLRAGKQWLVTTYDAENRTDSVGLLTDPTNYNNLAYYTAGALTTTPFPVIRGYPAYTVENYHHYDDYAWVTALHTTPTATMDTSYNGNTSYFITGYNAGPLYAVPLTPYMITRGTETGRIDYLLGTNQAQYTVDFYDDRSRTIEVQSNNYFRGLDKDITQYDFSGKPLRHLLVSIKNMNNYQVHYVSDQYSYDAAFRPTGMKDNIDGTLIVVDTLTYNELGQLQKKTLGNGLDSLVYTYNIRGWMTGINKNYIAGTATDYFGLELAYDRQTSVSTTTYAAAQYNGNITGLIWKSAGDQTNRKYDFTYDHANRLTAANFLQNPGGSTWNKTAMDYSVGYLNYDDNGNIYGMDQWGFKLGAPTGLIDELQYHYQANSNQLSYVNDLVNDTASTLGDFHYKTKGAYDYLYDGNGNLKIDNNKGIDSIGYNFLNLVQYVHIKGKGTIQYAYSTAGEKQAKIVTDSTQSPVKVTTTSYLKAYQYVNDTLEQYNFGEGRQRYQKLYQLSGDSLYSNVYDYFLKDHLGNTRVVLTTEKDTAQYIATMEPATRATENALFYNIDSTSYATSAVPGGYPGGTDGGTNDSVAMVSGSQGDHTQGPAIILKVMTGDSVSFGVNSYYVGSGTSTNTSSSLSSVLGTLAGGLITLGAGGGENGSFAALNSNPSSPVLAALNSFLPTYDPATTSTPKAYLNWMLLDNQFNYVSGNGQSGALPVGSPNVLNTLATTIKLKHSGYLYIWVSNETQNWSVFFDKLSVEHFNGPMLEETHYYPFGLTMAGISDKAFKTPYAYNKYKANGGDELQNKEFSDGSGLEAYDAKFRMYDPQIGRFWQQDPLAITLVSLSPYQFATNNPILFSDPFGLDTVRVNGEGSHRIQVRQGDVLAWTIGQTTSYYTYDPGNENATDGFVGNGINDGSMAPVSVYGSKQHDNATPGQLGVEWLTGLGPRAHYFHDGDPFTRMLQNHDHIEDTRALIAGQINSSGGASGITGRNPYGLGGLKGIPLYMRDYSTLLTGGLTGNLAVTFLGGYGLRYEVLSVDEQNGTAEVHFVVDNKSNVESLMHAPYIGYTEWWKNNIGQPVNDLFKTGPLSPTTQNVQWTETIKYK